MAKKTIRRQKPIPGGRDYMSAALIGRIYDAVEREAARYGVAKSFVVAVRLAESYGIKEQEKY